MNYLEELEYHIANVEKRGQVIRELKHIILPFIISGKPSQSAKWLVRNGWSYQQDNPLLKTDNNTMGHKDDSYFTELEMLNGYTFPEYDDVKGERNIKANAETH